MTHPFYKQASLLFTCLILAGCLERATSSDVRASVKPELIHFYLAKPVDQQRTFLISGPKDAKTAQICEVNSDSQCQQGTVTALTSIKENKTNFAIFNASAFALKKGGNYRIDMELPGTQTSRLLEFSKPKKKDAIVNTSFPKEKNLYLLGKKGRTTLAELAQGKEFLLIDFSGAHCPYCFDYAAFLERKASPGSGETNLNLIEKSGKCKFVTVLNANELQEWENESKRYPNVRSMDHIYELTLEDPKNVTPQTDLNNAAYGILSGKPKQNSLPLPSTLIFNLKTFKTDFEFSGAPKQVAKFDAYCK